MQYYIIDDLRLPPKRTFHKGWTMERFPSLQEALARYRALPSRQAKSLGMTDGIHVLELARHVLIYPAEAAWEDVQAASRNYCGYGRRYQRRRLRQKTVSPL